MYCFKHEVNFIDPKGCPACRSDSCQPSPASDGYRWIENGERILETDEYAPSRPLDPNADCQWRLVPIRNIGRIYYDSEYTGTRRKR